MQNTQPLISFGSLNHRWGFLYWLPVKQLPKAVSGRRGSTVNLMPDPTAFHKAQLT